MNRFELYNTQLQEYLGIKATSFQYKARVELSSFKIKAGLYKPSALFTQHSLILASITGLAPIIISQVHGKRKRRTNSLTVGLYGKQQIWPFHDKFLHELIPFMAELGVSKIRKGIMNRAKSISIRWRKKLGTLSEFAYLVSAPMQDTYRGVYLPLTVNLIFTEFTRYTLIEQYIRMLRLPLVLFRRGSRGNF
jgi:hypothetical protein